jgi:hypothetical protein
MPRLAGARCNGGAVAPAAGGFNGMSLSVGDGAISGGASLPGAGRDSGAGMLTGGMMSALPGASFRELGGEAASGVCAWLAIAPIVPAARPKAAASQIHDFIAAERLNMILTLARRRSGAPTISCDDSTATGMWCNNRPATIVATRMRCQYGRAELSAGPRRRRADDCRSLHRGQAASVPTRSNRRFPFMDRASLLRRGPCGGSHGGGAREG